MDRRFEALMNQASPTIREEVDAELARTRDELTRTRNILAGIGQSMLAREGEDARGLCAFFNHLVGQIDQLRTPHHVREPSTDDSPQPEVAAVGSSIIDSTGDAEPTAADMVVIANESSDTGSSSAEKKSATESATPPDSDTAADSSTVATLDHSPAAPPTPAGEADRSDRGATEDPSVESDRGVDPSASPSGDHGSTTPDPLDNLVKAYEQRAKEREPRSYLPNSVELPRDLETAWLTLHLACLRLPEATATEWRRAFAAAVDVETDPRQPGVPRLHNREPVELSAVHAPDCEPYNKIRQLLGARAQQFPAVVSHVGDVWKLLALGERERLQHLNSAGPPQPLSNDKIYDRYIANLSNRLEALSNSPNRTADLVRLISIDEYLRSVVHDPLPAPRSWWDKVTDGLLPLIEEISRDTKRDINPLTESYDKVRDDFTDKDRNIKRPGPIGTVLRVLRLAYQESDGVWVKGRVIYGTG